MVPGEEQALRSQTVLGPSFTLSVSLAQSAKNHKTRAVKAQRHDGEQTLGGKNKLWSNHCYRTLLGFIVVWPSNSRLW